MYISLLFLVAIFAPILGIIRAVKKQENPYKACLQGIFFAGFGILLIFILASATGNSIAKEITDAIKANAETLAANDNIFKAMKLEDLSHDERVDAVTGIYQYAAEALPAAMLIIAAIFSYIETMILSRVIRAKGQLPVPLPPIREFSYPQNTLMGWFFIFIISWILKAANLPQGEMVVINLDLLFQFSLSVQGISLLFLIAHLKKIPRGVPAILVIILWISGVGKIALFIAGALDLIFGLRYKIKV